jgi:cytohesin
MLLLLVKRQQLKRLENCAHRDDGWLTVKSQLITIVAALLVVGCGPSVDIWTGAQTGNIEAVKQHLADGVDVNSKSDIGRTPLDVAIAFKQPLITDLLRKHGGKTRDELKAAESIVVAVELGNIEAVKQHLNDGTEVNAKGGTGRTPLHWAAIEGHKEIAELLIAEGADVNAKTNDGKTPLDEAINPFYNKTEIANLLRKHGGKHGTIHSAVGGGDVEAVKEFLAAGADVNVKDKRRFTPLHWASISGHKEAVELLIDNGADVNAMRGGGGTPLSYAASWGHEEIVELLIANGADVNVKDAFSETPLDVATHPDNPNASAETADLLRKHGGKTKKELEAAGK